MMVKFYTAWQQQLLKVEEKLANVWLLDSGVIWLMISHREWFHQYKPISEGFVFMGNDHALEIVGISTIKSKIYNGTVRTIKEIRQEKSIFSGTIK
ncbi:hypothetical protein LguiA_024060 [Lonicera macranthoides]